MSLLTVLLTFSFLFWYNDSSGKEKDYWSAAEWNMPPSGRIGWSRKQKDLLTKLSVAPSRYYVPAHKTTYSNSFILFLLVLYFFCYQATTCLKLLIVVVVYVDLCSCHWQVDCGYSFIYSFLVTWEPIHETKMGSVTNGPSRTVVWIGLLWTMISSCFTCQARRSTCSRKCHLVLSSAPPTDPPQKKQTTAAYCVQEQGNGHPHEHNITEQAISCTGLSSMMYVVDRYLPHQSSDSFDIFISMSSIINHPGEVRPIPPPRAASDYRWKTKLSDTLPRVLCLSRNTLSRVCV